MAGTEATPTQRTKESEHCVLVVDDEALIRWALGQRLEEQGYRVLQAADARSALELAEEADLVLVERELPDGDGRDVSLKLRGARPQRPLILTTAYCGPDLEQFARGGGVDAVVEKPFALEDMLQLIRRLLVAA
jgi:CheY-like chemotaxis protein